MIQTKTYDVHLADAPRRRALGTLTFENGKLSAARTNPKAENTEYTDSFWRELVPGSTPEEILDAFHAFTLTETGS